MFADGRNFLQVQDSLGGRTLVINNEVGSGAERVKSINKWSLSGDGKALTDVLSISSPQGDMEVIYVRVKQ